MCRTNQCVSTVGGLVYAERPAIGYEETRSVIGKLSNAQVAWATWSLQERVEPVTGDGLSVIGYHSLTRPKSYHLKKAGNS